MQAFTLNIRGKLYSYEEPAVMGIINATPDSFYGASRVSGAGVAAGRAAAMVADGAKFIDVGACSTRPGSASPTAEEEYERLAAVVPAIREAIGDKAHISIDTYRADVARKAVEELGADIINDVAGGLLDKDMFDTVADLQVPYILMHMRGTPQDMQEYAKYDDVTADVLAELGERLGQLSMMGVNDVIVDPGFGFAKTLEQNYELLGHMNLLHLLHRPLLVGVSRKSMATRLLGITADDALEATTALNTLALTRGAAILRVHDVKAAVHAVAVYNATAKWLN
ncbi:MAG: dihydropteroate synthase [Muribaculaceae bacterium]